MSPTAPLLVPFLALALLASTTTARAQEADRLEERPVGDESAPPDDDDDEETAAPAVEAPAPAVEAPAPVVEAPAPVVEAPVPVVEAPVPVVEAPAPAVPPIPEVPPAGSTLPPVVDEGPFARGGLGHYALWYGPEWVFVAAVGAAEALSLWDLVPVMPPLIGPYFVDDDPDPAVLTDPRLDGVIGRPFVREQVPPLVVAGAGLSALALAGGVDALKRTDLHHTHSLVLGGLTAVTSTLLVVNATKTLTGRLRPDYRDRYARGSCQGYAPRSDVIDCEQATADGFVLSRHDYIDGHRSFPSGHAASSFAFATYLSLWLGSEFVWSDDAGDIAPALGTLGIGALYSAALFTAATRVTDNRHHLEDVAVGAGIGTGMAAASWLLHFDLDGNARWRGFDVVPGPGEAGLALAGAF